MAIFVLAGLAFAGITVFVVVDSFRQNQSPPNWIYWPAATSILLFVIALIVF